MEAVRTRKMVTAALAVGFTIAAGSVVLNLQGNEKQVDQTVARLYDVRDEQFARAMGVLLGPAILQGNRFDVLLNGDEIFPSMLSAIRSAERSITFESYIYWSGSIGREFADALSERARAGVKVHVLLDWLGSSKLDATQIAAMEASGVNVRRFHAPVWYRLERMNNRTHRKLLVVDGKVGFTGGVGIADEWAGHAEDPAHWRDTHFRAEGPVVAQMQAVFMDNWIKVSGEVLHGAAYFPPLYHCKVMVVDGVWLSVGSTNFDRRSFSLNDEANLNIADTDFAERQIAIFQQDLARSKAMTYVEWQQRPVVEKLIEHTASLLRMQL